MHSKALLYKVIFIFCMALLFSSGHIENVDTHLRLTQARFLVENGSFEIEEGFGEASHGNLATSKSGKKFSVYNPGQILLFTPIYFLTHLFEKDIGDAYYSAAFLASFFGYLIYGIIIITFWKFGSKLNIPERKRFLVTILFAFTSYCFAHAQDSYEHIYEALFLFLTVFLLVSKTTSQKMVILAGISLGFGLLFRTSIILALPGIFLVVNKRKSIILFLSTLLPFFLILLYYNYVRFGDAFENGYAIAWLNAFGKTPENSFNLLSIPRNVAGLLFSFGKGLFFFSPSLILTFWGFKQCWKSQERLFAGIALICIVYVSFYAANFAWHGSAWNWGPRYIVPIVPLLYLILFYIPNAKKKLMITIGIVSFVVQILAIATFYKRNLIQINMQQGDIFWSDRYFFSPKYSPIKGQLFSFIEVTRSMASTEPKELFLPGGPWRNENRPASQQTMLKNSIDLSVYNFWWVRTLYTTNKRWVIVLTLSIVVFAMIVLINQMIFLWNQIKKKEIG